MPNLERLKACLAANEAEDPAIQFSMDTWATKTACKTVACLIGTYILKTKCEGLELEWEDSEEGSEENYCEANPLNPTQPYEVRPFVILAAHFGITKEEAEHLFSPWRYNQEIPRDVAVSRLREFILMHETTTLQI